MSKVFFSIVVPAYNRAHILPQTIKSVIDQTFSDWELVIIDDGSTDNTAEIASSIADCRIRYFYQTNAERSAARNNGISKSTGTYICFLDSDDWFEPQHLAVLKAEIDARQQPEALFFTGNYLYQNNKKWTAEQPTMNADALNYLLHHPVIPARVCIHQAILQKYRFRQDIVIVEDQVLWTTIAAHYPVFQILQHTVVYHLHDDNSINIKKNCFRPRLDGLRLLFKQADMRSRISTKTKRRIISDCYLGIARHFAFKNKRFVMRWNLLLSILYAPLHEQTKYKLYCMIFPIKSLQ